MSIDKDTTIPEEKEFIDWTERLTETVNKKENDNFTSKIKSNFFYKEKSVNDTDGCIKKMTIGSF
ncbi:MAG: hypothetical protein QM204_00230 [Bacillota bacterium]|mgnify:CR=1 FL=1|nr:hypothetical protein [Bacillota bacterium]NLL26764.1 hypothetical protein [Erysipelotrichia bacterium]